MFLQDNSESRETEFPKKEYLWKFYPESTSADQFFYYQNSYSDK